MGAMAAITLDQNDSLHLLNGNLANSVTVSRDGNIIDGHSGFTGPVSLLSEDSELINRFDVKFNNYDVALNNGTFALGNDIHLSQDYR